MVERYPDLTFEQARVQANAMLDKAAGRRVYRFPTVLSQEQEDKQREKFASMRAKTASQDADSSHLQGDIGNEFTELVLGAAE